MEIKKNADMMDNIKKLFKFETTTKLLCFHEKKLLCFHKNNFTLKCSVSNLNNHKYRTIHTATCKLC